MRGWIVGLLALGSTALAAAETPPGQTAPGLRNVQFRLVSTIDSARGVAIREIEPSGSIPNRPGTSCYTWYLTFAPTDAAVAIEESLQLPAPAPNWNSSSRTEVSPDRRSGRTALVFDGRRGLVSNGWCVAEGDPEGRYRFVISSGGHEVARMTFFVGEYL